MRLTDIKTKNILKIALTVIIGVAFLTTVIAALFFKVQNDRYVELLIMQTLALMMIPVNFHWGSSQSSEDQAEAMNNKS